MINYLNKLISKKETKENTLTMTEVITQKIAETTKEVENISKNYPKEVMEIHHEFWTAADKILAEANEIIAEAQKKDVQKVSRLEALGFKQVKEVNDLKPLIRQAKLSKEQVELVGYYKQKYPLNKYITEEQVKTICHKYNLVCGSVERFKGFVPTKNLNEIENFKLKPTEMPFLIVEGMYQSDIKFQLWEEDFTEHGKRYCPNSSFYIVGPRNNRNIYGTSPLLTEKCMDRFEDYVSLYVRKSNIQSMLQICAPVKDMDISGMELKEGYKLEQRYIPDPIVLQPVLGGYLILTAWGDEASDPLVVNEILN